MGGPLREWLHFGVWVVLLKGGYPQTLGRGGGLLGDGYTHILGCGLSSNGWLHLWSPTLGCRRSFNG